ncbi:MAG: hypothetical protein ACQETB_00775 [Halobacteriota archaeon]
MAKRNRRVRLLADEPLRSRCESRLSDMYAVTTATPPPNSDAVVSADCIVTTEPIDESDTDRQE